MHPDQIKGRIADIDAPGFDVRFHARCDIQGIPPGIAGEFADAEQARDQLPAGGTGKLTQR